MSTVSRIFVIELSRDSGKTWKPSSSMESTLPAAREEMERRRKANENPASTFRDPRMTFRLAEYRRAAIVSEK